MKNSKGNSIKKKKKGIHWPGIFAVLIIAVFVFVYVLSNAPKRGESTKMPLTSAASVKNDFRLDAKLQIFDGGNSLVDFYVEIADDDYSLEKGLMHRHFIPDTVGMLFIFPEEDHRFFWMKNTPASLDIIYADKNFEIIRIHQNTPPYSLDRIPSGDKAKYVIELKAGSVAKHHIQKGNSFTYDLLK